MESAGCSAQNTFIQRRNDYASDSYLIILFVEQKESEKERKRERERKKVY